MKYCVLVHNLKYYALLLFMSITFYEILLNSTSHVYYLFIHIMYSYSGEEQCTSVVLLF